MLAVCEWTTWRRSGVDTGDMMHGQIDQIVSELGEILRVREMRMALAESCTGGLMASRLTDISGSSEWFKGGIVAYDNRIKERLLAVPCAVLNVDGAVSQACVDAMVRGVCRLFDVPIGVAISGIAGPGGGSVEKPVGLVWMSWQVLDHQWSRAYRFHGSRLEVKSQSVGTAIEELLQGIKKRH